MDGKGISIWDAFSHKKGKIFLNDTADSSCEGYHKFKVTWKKNEFCSVSNCYTQYLIAQPI